MIYECYIPERELIHVLRCMFLAGALTGEELHSFTGSGYLDCEAMTLSCSEEDFLFVILTIQGTETLFNTLKGLETVAPLCLGTYQLEGAKHCSICLDDTMHDEWVPRLECNHIFHDACLLSWVTGTSAMKNHCPVCRTLINNKKQILLRVRDELLL